MYFVVLFVINDISNFNSLLYFYHATLYERGICNGPGLSVRLSQVGVILKWLNVGSRKQHHMIAQGI